MPSRILGIFEIKKIIKKILLVCFIILMSGKVSAQARIWF